MDLTPEQVVFGIAELVDKIFSFVDTKSLCQARQVCRTWREISKMSLKRRLQVISSHRDVIAFSEHEENSHFSKNPPRYLRVQDVMEPKFKFKSKVTRCTALLVTVLEQDWIGVVTSLELDRCLTVDEWNAVGCRIVNNFSVLARLEVEMTSSRATTVLPLEYSDMRNYGDSVLEFKFQFLEFVSLTLNVNDHDEEGEPTRVCLEVLDHCPELKRVLVEWDLEKFLGFIHIVASVIQEEHSENFNCFGCEIFEKGVPSEIPNKWAQMIMKDLAKVLTVTKPKDLTVFFPFHPDLAASIASSSPTELHTVTVDLETVYPVNDEDDWVFSPTATIGCCCGVAKQQPVEDPLLPLFSTAAFANAQKLVVKANLYAGKILPQHSRIMTTPFPKVSVVEIIRTWNEGWFEECEGRLPDSVLDRWMLNQLWSLAPNAQLLVVSFGAMRSRLTALKLAKNFPSLKHLVLVVLRPHDDGLETDAADLDATETQCLQGLQGVTVIAEVSDGLEDYIRAFVKACGSVSTIRKLSVHCMEELDREISLQGIDIPENLAVESRSIYEDSDKAVLEGVENSMMKWHHLILFQ